jgi:hypothetical protein
VRHRSGAALLQRQARLRAVERLDLRLLVDRQHDGVRRRVDIKPDDVAQLGGEVRVGGQFELPHPMRLQPVRAPDALHRGFCGLLRSATIAFKRARSAALTATPTFLRIPQTRTPGAAGESPSRLFCQILSTSSRRR